MAACDRVVAEGFAITHSNGDVLTKAQKRVDILAADPIAPGAAFQLGVPEVRCYGTAAVSVGVVHEQARDIRYTHTYVWERGRWRVVAAQLTSRRR